MNRTARCGLSSRLESEEHTPVTGYKDPRGSLVTRVAARTLLGMDIDLYRNDFATLCAAEAAPTSHPVVEWGNLTAVDLLLGGDGSKEARRCLHAYEVQPGESERVEVPASEGLIRMVVRAVGPATLRLDVQQDYYVVQNLGPTLSTLKKKLDAPAQQRFNKRRRDGDAVLEIAVVGAPIAGEAVFSDRVLAALELLGRKGFAIRKVVTRSAAS